MVVAVVVVVVMDKVRERARIQRTGEGGISCTEGDLLEARP